MSVDILAISSSLYFPSCIPLYNLAISFVGSYLLPYNRLISLEVLPIAERSNGRCFSSPRGCVFTYSVIFSVALTGAMSPEAVFEIYSGGGETGDRLREHAVSAEGYH